jgi:serine/threonine protein kinase/ankyrin repeat protein
MAANELEIGKIIDDRYQLVELLGAGGSGITYRAIRLEDRSDVAIKILSLRHLNDWKQLELFEREAKVLSQLNHPQIPKYLEYFHLDTDDNRTFWIVQQLAPGKSLTEWVNAGWRGTEAEVKDITSQLLSILQYLHQQSPPLIHRDIKPHNIIRDEDGRVFLVDFGAVQNVYHDTLLHRNTVAGTYGYMAPEQFRGAAEPASDLYGLGATILYVLTHRSPADLPQSRLKLVFRDRVNISERFADWLETMLEPEPVDRFASADIALTALEKQHRFRQRFRQRQGIKIGFPWRSAAVVAAILMIFIPLISRYRYEFLTRIGLPPRDLCAVIETGDIGFLNEYLAHGVSLDEDVATYSERTASLLRCAIQAGEVEAVKYLLANGASIHSLDRSEGTLIAAISAQQLDIVKLLIANGAQVKDKNAYGQTPLMAAIDRQKSDLNLVKLLIVKGANINDKNGYEQTALIAAIDHRRLDMVELLIEKGAKVNDDRDQHGQTPLMAAISDRQLDMVELLISKGAKVDDDLDKHGQTLLLKAIDGENFDIVELLISKGAGVDVRNTSGQTPLMVAIATGDKNHDGKYSPQEFINPEFKLSLDKNQSIPKIIELLLERGADPNLSDITGDTAAHYIGNLGKVHPMGDNCIQQRSLALYTLDLLMLHKVDRQAINKDGNTALHVLARQDFFPVTEKMISYGWDADQKDRSGRNALQLMKAVKSRESRCPDGFNG